MQRCISSKHPMLIVAIALIVGIIMGHIAHNWIDTNTWLCIFALSATTTAFTIAMPNNACNYITQYISIASIGIATIAFGAWNTNRCINNLSIASNDMPETYRGVVACQPVKGKKSVRCEIIVTRGRLKGHHIIAYLDNNAAEQLQVGCGIEATSVITPTCIDSKQNSVNSKQANKRNRLPYKKQASYNTWLKAQNISGTTYIQGHKWQRCKPDIQKLALMCRLRVRLLTMRSLALTHMATYDMNNEAFGVVAAMSLGYRSHINDTLRQSYTTSGASHVLALSGLHLGIIYSILTYILMARRKRNVLTQAIIITTIWTYAALVGMGPSVVRSAIMMSMMSICMLRQQGAISPNALATAAVTILAMSPLSITDIGFQMSFVAVAAILAINNLINDTALTTLVPRKRFWRWMWQMVIISVAAQTAVAPLSAMYFNSLPMYFVITNFVAIPLTTVILGLTICVVALTPFHALQHIAVSMLEATTNSLNFVLTTIANLPGASINNLHPTWIQVAIAYALLITLWMAAKKATRIIAVYS